MSLAALFDLGWKSGLIAAAALAGSAMLRGRPPSERVAVLRFGIILILTLPISVAIAPALRVEAPRILWPLVSTPRDGGRPRPGSTIHMATQGEASDRELAAPSVVSVQRQMLGMGPSGALLSLWALGVVGLVFHLCLGVALLSLWTRRSSPVAEPRWLAALDRAAEGASAPALRTSTQIGSPLSWGLRPAFVLLDKQSLSRAEQADAILTHEMAHVRRGDWVFLIASRLVVAALWFNPLAWQLQSELARQSEQAADAWAAQRVGRTDYAAVLLSLAARRNSHVALGMAAPVGEMRQRVTAILNSAPAAGKPWRAAAALIGCLVIAPLLAAIDLRAPTEVLSKASANRFSTGDAPPASTRFSGKANRARPLPQPSPSPAAHLVRDADATATAVIAQALQGENVEGESPAGIDRLDGSAAEEAYEGESDDRRRMVSSEARRTFQSFDQRQMTAEGLRSGAYQIERQIKIIRKAAIASGDPRWRENVSENTHEMLAEAEALRREAAEIEGEG